MLGSEGAPEAVIFHCFSSDAAMARTCADHGWLMSLSGTVGFRNAHARAPAIIRRSCCWSGTDAPFLTPHPFRGAPNESYCLPYTVRALAEIRASSAAEIAAVTSENASKSYGL